MKKRIQKYLSGSNEGFSLVELIIVIAIMAILVGVVALAVIPYLAKSRESKDLQALDTVASAATHAVADAKVTGTGSITIDTTTDWPTGLGDDEQKVMNGIKSTLGDTLPVFSSDGCKDVKDLTIAWDTKANVVVAYVPNSVESRKYEATGVTVGTMGSTIDVAACQYNDNALFCVSNAKVEGKATEVK